MPAFVAKRHERFDSQQQQQQAQRGERGSTRATPRSAYAGFVDLRDEQGELNSNGGGLRRAAAYRTTDGEYSSESSDDSHAIARTAYRAMPAAAAAATTTQPSWRDNGGASGWAPWPLQTKMVAASTSSARRSDFADGTAAADDCTPTSSPFDHAPMGMSNADSPPTTPPDSTTLRISALLPSPSVAAVKLVSDGEVLPPTKIDSPSRNDIFSIARAQPMPAPRLAPIVVTQAPRSSSSSSNVASGSSPASSSNTSKNSLFFGSSPVPSSAGGHASSLSFSIMPAPVLKPTSANATLSPSPPAHGLRDADRPSYGRSSIEERERERARIRQSRDEVDFRLCPTKDFLLGEGRHCSVFLGSYRLKRRRTDTRGTQAGGVAAVRNADADAAISRHVEQEDEEQDGPGWQLCAVKRLHADRQAQLLGLDEAFALRRLGSHPHIIRLIDIRDEVQLASTSPLPGAPAGVWAGVAPEGAGPREAAAQQARMTMTPTLSLPSHLSSAHGRSTSETHSRAQLGLSTQDASMDVLDARSVSHSQHRRLASQPLDTPSSASTYDAPLVRVAAPDDEGEGQALARSRTPSPAAGAAASEQSNIGRPLLTPASSSSSTLSVDPPRLLILLELLPHSLSTFARRHPERVDWSMWRTWAGQLAETVDWMHGKGCVHADIKKENILLTDSLNIKLCDFNSALFPSANAHLLDGAGLGTPAYGAPELTRTSGGNSGFSFPIDIWSMGAVLYSLATGVEPFERARSMIDMLYRKRVFFESEENDRIARLSVAEGYGGSNAGSACASRNGSLRGRTARSNKPSLRRETSVDSIESVASSIRVAGGNASLRNIAMLLDAAPPIGLLVAPASQPRQEEELAAEYQYPLHGHHRAVSLGKSSQLNPARQSNGMASVSTGSHGSSTPGPVSAHLSAPLRPPVLRRTSSYGGDTGDASSTAPPTPSSPPSHYLNAPSTPHSPRSTNASLRLAVTATLAQASRRAAQTQTHEPSSPPDTPPGSSVIASPSSFYARQLGRTSDSGDFASSSFSAFPQNDDEEMDLDLRPYRDGSPALILPGGGRLPDAARALLERMLSTDPALRPTASEVVAALRKL